MDLMPCSLWVWQRAVHHGCIRQVQALSTHSSWGRQVAGHAAVGGYHFMPGRSQGSWIPGGGHQPTTALCHNTGVGTQGLQSRSGMPHCQSEGGVRPTYHHVCSMCSWQCETSFVQASPATPRAPGPGFDPWVKLRPSSHSFSCREKCTSRVCPTAACLTLVSCPDPQDVDTDLSLFMTSHVYVYCVCECRKLTGRVRQPLCWAMSVRVCLTQLWRSQTQQPSYLWQVRRVGLAGEPGSLRAQAGWEPHLGQAGPDVLSHRQMPHLTFQTSVTGIWCISKVWCWPWPWVQADLHGAACGSSMSALWLA